MDELIGLSADQRAHPLAESVCPETVCIDATLFGYSANKPDLFSEARLSPSPLRASTDPGSECHKVSLRAGEADMVL